MTDARTLVYLARHGQTALNESGVLRGLLDPPLDETGRRQAADLGASLGPRQPSLVVASPLLRARETAHPVADHAGLTVTPDGCLLDRDYGQWAGTPRDAVVAQWGADRSSLPWPRWVRVRARSASRCHICSPAPAACHGPETAGCP